jgi:hypothetical protein
LEESILRKQYTPAFIGISNWDLDASKLNRNVYLARPDLDNENLIETSKTIIKYQSEKSLSSNNDDEITNLSTAISKTYSEFRTRQKVTSILSFEINFCRKNVNIKISTL